MNDQSAEADYAMMNLLEDDAEDESRAGTQAFPTTIDIEEMRAEIGFGASNDEGTPPASPRAQEAAEKAAQHATEEAAERPPSMLRSVGFCLKHVQLGKPPTYHALSLDHCANQRTYEAGTRTSLALFVMGTALARFILVRPFSIVPLYSFVLAAVGLFAYATYRYFRVQELLFAGYFEANRWGVFLLFSVAFLFCIYSLVEVLFM